MSEFKKRDYSNSKPSNDASKSRPLKLANILFEHIDGFTIEEIEEAQKIVLSKLTSEYEVYVSSPK
jgi:hypothetical protein